MLVIYSRLYIYIYEYHVQSKIFELLTAFLFQLFYFYQIHLLKCVDEQIILYDNQHNNLGYSVYNVSAVNEVLLSLFSEEIRQILRYLFGKYSAIVVLDRYHTVLDRTNMNIYMAYIVYKNYITMR